MTSVAVETRQARIVPALGRLATFVLVVAALWGAWEGYKWLWETTGWTWPFVVDDTTMPHHPRHPRRVQGADHRRAARALIHPLLDAAWFTAKEAIAGFVLGAVFGFGLAVVLVALAPARARPPAVRRRLADGADPRDRADGRHRARLEGRRGLEGRRRCSPRTSRSSRSRSTRCAACSRPTRAPSS